MALDYSTMRSDFPWSSEFKCFILRIFTVFISLLVLCVKNIYGSPIFVLFRFIII